MRVPLLLVCGSVIDAQESHRMLGPLLRAEDHVGLALNLRPALPLCPFRTVPLRDEVEEEVPTGVERRSRNSFLFPCAVARRGSGARATVPAPNCYLTADQRPLSMAVGTSDQLGQQALMPERTRGYLA